MKRCSRCHNLRDDDAFILGEHIFKLCQGCRKGKKEKPNNRLNKRRCSRCCCWKDYEEFIITEYEQMKTCHKCRTKGINYEDCIIKTIRQWINNSKSHDKKYNRYDKDNFIDIYFLIELIKEYPNCIYCQVPVQYRKFKSDLGTIERIDNKIGHIKSNCVIACFKCNVGRVKKS